MSITRFSAIPLTLIYLREAARQPAPMDFSSMPQRGQPIGAVAFRVVHDDSNPENSYFEFAYALAHSEKDPFNREKCRKIVLARFEKKRERQNPEWQSGGYRKIKGNFPNKFMSYDAISTLLKLNETDPVLNIPPRMINSLRQMTKDNVLRTARLEFLRGPGMAYKKVQDLLESGVKPENIQIEKAISAFCAAV